MKLEELRQYKPQILALAEKYGVENIRIFGSVARGDAKPESDIDFMVNMKGGSGMWELAGMWHEMEELLHCKVDLVPENAAYAHILTAAQQEGKPL